MQAQCQAFNIDLKWLPCLAEMMFQSLNTRLLASEPDLCLAILEPEHCLIEMEFYFPLSPIQASGLQAIFTTHSQYDLNGLQFNQVEGMLKGFVDLIFAFKGKYYVLDYKSNHLGHQRADYHKDQLTPVMIHSQYILQYHIYTVALYRYLQRRLPDFDYESHMGGSLYLFLRGLHTDFGAEYGVFYDLPSEALISALSDYFTQELER